MMDLAATLPGTMNADKRAFLAGSFALVAAPLTGEAQRPPNPCGSGSSRRAGPH